MNAVDGKSSEVPIDSASAAGAFGFLIFIQACDDPERYGAFSIFTNRLEHFAVVKKYLVDDLAVAATVIDFLRIRTPHIVPF